MCLVWLKSKKPFPYRIWKEHRQILFAIGYHSLNVKPRSIERTSNLLILDLGRTVRTDLENLILVWFCVLLHMVI